MGTGFSAVPFLCLYYMVANPNDICWQKGHDPKDTCFLWAPSLECGKAKLRTSTRKTPTFLEKCFILWRGNREKEGLFFPISDDNVGVDPSNKENFCEFWIQIIQKNNGDIVQIITRVNIVKKSKSILRKLWNLECVVKFRFKLRRTEDFVQVHVVNFKHKFCTDNGIVCYSIYYSPPKVNSDYDVWGYYEGEDQNRAWEIPECIWHGLKELYHEHEFHDTYHETITMPFCMSDSTDSDQTYVTCMRQCLEEFNIYFHKKREDATRYWIETHVKSSLNRRFSIYWKRWVEDGGLDKVLIIKKTFRYLFLILLVCVTNICIIYLADNDSWLYRHKYSILVTWNALLLIGYFVMGVKRKAKYLSSMILRMEGTEKYAKTLMQTIPPNEKNDPKWLYVTHNITNNCNTTKSYLEAHLRNSQTRSAIWTFFVSIILALLLFFLSESGLPD